MQITLRLAARKIRQALAVGRERQLSNIAIGFMNLLRLIQAEPVNMLTIPIFSFKGYPTAIRRAGTDRLPGIGEIDFPQKITFCEQLDSVG